MNKNQLAALTEDERRNLPSEPLSMAHDVLLKFVTALADARLEVARLTEERDNE